MCPKTGGQVLIDPRLMMENSVTLLGCSDDKLSKRADLSASPGTAQSFPAQVC